MKITVPTGALLLALMAAGGAARSTDPLIRSADRMLSVIERAADRAGREAGQLRQSISRKNIAPSLYEAATAGAVSGWLCGKLIVGDPNVMAILGSSACIYAMHKQPSNRFGLWANRLTYEFRALRLAVADAVSTRQ